MKYFCLISLALIVLIQNAAAWAIGGYYYNPANPGKCTYNETLILSPGEEINNRNKSCTKITCHNEKGELSILGCGVYMIPPNCRSGELIDSDAPYPKCCEIKWICSDNHDENKRIH